MGRWEFTFLVCSLQHHWLSYTCSLSLPRAFTHFLSHMQSLHLLTCNNSLAPLLLCCIELHDPQTKVKLLLLPMPNRTLEKNSNSMKNSLPLISWPLSSCEPSWCHLAIPLYTSNPFILLRPLMAIVWLSFLKPLHVLILAFHFSEKKKESEEIVQSFHHKIHWSSCIWARRLCCLSYHLDQQSLLPYRAMHLPVYYIS